MKLNELIPQLESCEYECEAGNLKCNVAFRQIKKIVERLDEVYFKQCSTPETIGEYTTRSELDKLNAQIQLMNYIITGLDGAKSDEIRDALKDMGYE